MRRIILSGVDIIPMFNRQLGRKKNIFMTQVLLGSVISNWPIGAGVKEGIGSVLFCRIGGIF